MSRKTALSKRKAKRLIKTNQNNVETTPAPDAKKPAKRGVKFYLFIVLMLVFNGFAYSYWLTDIFDDVPQTQSTQAKNLPPQNQKTKSVELPPDWDLPPQNTPVDMGYNASSGQFPPGALPPGVRLPGISGMNSTMAGRTIEQGYGASDGIRQNFTGQIRDAESNLLYYGARYYNPQHGRFTSVDPENASADLEDPQSWNAYAYARNNPLLYTDPDGREYKICDLQGNCWTHTDANFKKGQKLEPGIFQLINRDGYYDSGNILDADGNRIGTYQRTSIDPEYQLVYGIADQSVRKAKVVGGLAAGAAGVGVCIGLPGACPAVARAALTRIGPRTVTATTAASVPVINSVDKLLKAMTNVTRLTSKTQGVVRGNAQQIFDNITKGGTKLPSGAVRLADGTVVKLYNSHKPGPLQGPTISVNQAGKMTSVRIIP